MICPSAATPVRLAAHRTVVDEESPTDPSPPAAATAAPTGDDVAFAALLSSAPIQRFLRLRASALTGNLADAADLVQDTVMRALQTHGGRVPAYKARAWLVVVMRNLFISRWRSERSWVVEHQFVDDLVAPEDEKLAEWRKFDLEDVRAALPSVSPALRAVYRLCELEGVPYAQVAARLEVPLGTVASRLMRARAQLRRALLQRAPLALTSKTPANDVHPAAA